MDGQRPLAQLITIGEMADLFRRTGRTIRNCIRGDVLKPIQIGRSVFFREADVLALLGFDVARGDAAAVAADGPTGAVNSAV